MHPDPQPIFRALADPTRRDILHLLSQKPMTIGQVTEVFPMTRAAVKKHLSILESGNLISVETHGRTRLNLINNNGLKPVLNWLHELESAWDDRLSALKSAIEKDAE